MAKVKDIQVIDNLHPSGITTVPGISIYQFKRNGEFPSVEDLLRLEMETRLKLLLFPYDDKGKFLFDWNVIQKDRIIFTSSVKLSVKRQLYSDETILHRVPAKLCLGFVGRSSFCTICQICAHGTTEPILEQTTQIVTVDRVSHKPKPFPKWIQTKYEGRGIRKSGFRVIPKPRPQNTVVRKFMVQWSDTDLNNHCNMACYARFATDSIRYYFCQEKKRKEIDHQIRNTDSSAIKSLKECFIDNGLKDIELCFLNECVEGDQLETHLWQEEGETHKVICSVYHDDTHLCQMHLEFFDSEIS